MKDLFGEDDPVSHGYSNEVMRTAYISECTRYCYWLKRQFAMGGNGKTLYVCGLNPSTADATQDDPTIRRLLGLTKSLDYSTLHMLNLFAYRATDPDELLKVGMQATVGPLNDAMLLEAACSQDMVLAAWGALPKALQSRERSVLALLFHGKELHCLGTTKDGSPRHPLYLKSDVKPMVWSK